MATKITIDEILFKKGPESTIPTLKEGEPGVTTDTGKMFYGTASGNVKVATEEDVVSVSSEVSKKTTVYQQATEPPNASEGELWVDTSDNSFQGTVFASLARKTGTVVSDSTAADITTLKNDFNSLLAVLRTSGIIG